MKRILFIFLAALWLMPSVAMAHSKIELAVPAQDETLDASPQQIEMTFNTKIEKLSNFKLFNAAGEEMDTEKAEVNGATMSGKVLSELPNGIYTVKWTIIGADGHSVEGNYSFTVEAPIVEPTVEPTPEPEATTTPIETTAPSPEATADQGAATENTDNTNYTPTIIIGAIIVVAALFLLLRRRK
ncbi:hypothetical protein FHS15_000003 [Paenibacillus castaneae]|uniref:copper resistance CopC family protein n=1 Tax=Paenibacillus castaneae TaxID=474957 RepID=UPI000C9C204E|nr:copper resistance protein CopC [Paenibacillus castaneae]NIK74905.1 hypothetical protein [Paenibacillus castaneae]